MTETTSIRCYALAGESMESSTEGARWHTVLTVGTKEGRPARGPSRVSFTRGDLDGFAEAFDREVPIDLHHSTMMGKTDPESTKARGWIKALRVAGDALQALIKWTEEGAGLVKSEAFKYFSIELAKRGETICVTGGTLTNHPFWDLPALAATDAAFHSIGSHAGGSIVGPANTRAEPINVATKEKPMSDEIKALANRLGCEVDKVDETITALSKRLDDTTADNAELRATVAGIQADRAVETLLRDGKITADEEPAARELHALSADMFGKVYSTRETGSRVPVGEVGQDAEDTTTDAALTQEAAADKLDEIAKGIDSDPANYAAAFAQAIQDNRALYAAYMDEEV
jgi:hypothetical protein